MYTVIRRYRIDPKNADAVSERVRSGFVPIIRNAPGFIEYCWVSAGPGEALSIGVFQDEAGAKESTRLAAEFVKNNIAALLPNPPEIVSGEVVVREVRGADAAGQPGARRAA